MWQVDNFLQLAFCRRSLSLTLSASLSLLSLLTSVLVSTIHQPISIEAFVNQTLSDSVYTIKCCLCCLPTTSQSNPRPRICLYALLPRYRRFKRTTSWRHPRSMCVKEGLLGLEGLRTRTSWATAHSPGCLRASQNSERGRHANKPWQHPGSCPGAPAALPKRLLPSSSYDTKQPKQRKMVRTFWWRSVRKKAPACTGFSVGQV